MNNRCKYCEEGYVKKNGVYTPCKHCMTPERFEKTLNTAIANCGGDLLKQKALIRVKENLPEYPVMAILEAEHYGKFTKEFMSMLRLAYDIKPFVDANYKPI